MLIKKTYSLFLIATVILISLLETNAQTKKVTIPGKSRYMKIEAEVLEDNPAVKSGPAKTLVHGNVVESGVYVNNEKQGLWVYSDRSSNDRLEFDHTTNTIVFDNREVTRKVDSLFAQYNQNPEAEKAPVLLGSTEVLYSQLQQDFKIPVAALRAGTSGEMLASISVDENGAPTDYKIIKSLEKGLDQELLRVLPLAVKGMKWLPSKTKDGKSTLGEYILAYRIMIK